MVRQLSRHLSVICLKSVLTGRLSGNIGYVASKVAQEARPDEYLITELSSFQLLGIESINLTLQLLLIFTQHISIIMKH